MTTRNPDSGNALGLLLCIQTDVNRLRGLLEAMAHLRHQIGPDGLALDAVITSGVQLGREIDHSLSGMIEVQS